MDADRLDTVARVRLGRKIIMTREEYRLVEELRGEIDCLVKQYVFFIEVRDEIVRELRACREENAKLKVHNRLNGCYFDRAGPILPFKHRG